MASTAQIFCGIMLTDEELKRVYRKSSGTPLSEIKKWKSPAPCATTTSGLELPVWTCSNRLNPAEDGEDRCERLKGVFHYPRSPPTAPRRDMKILKPEKSSILGSSLLDLLTIFRNVYECWDTDCMHLRRQIANTIPKCQQPEAIAIREVLLTFASCYMNIRLSLGKLHLTQDMSGLHPDQLGICPCVIGHFEKMINDCLWSIGVEHEINKAGLPGFPSTLVCSHGHTAIINESNKRVKDDCISCAVLEKALGVSSTDSNLFRETYFLMNWLRGLSISELSRTALSFTNQWRTPTFLKERPLISPINPFHTVILEDSDRVKTVSLCPQRVWSLVETISSGDSDLPTMLELAEHSSLSHPGHEECTATFCEFTTRNFTSITQMHTPKCVNRQMPQPCQKSNPDMFSQQVLTDGIANPANTTAWSLCGKTLLPADPISNPYMALSHVWSDGTGVGTWAPGQVNMCLWEMFTELAKKLNCKGIWWDAICIPVEKAARAKALANMHRNYQNAEVTLVHDRGLMDVLWTDDGAPALALVLSNWFTRGWTALELFLSRRAMVLFKSPDGVGLVIKDLDTEVLAQNPFTSTRGHLLATQLLQKLRSPPRDVDALLTALRTRYTSWASDRPIITGFFAGLTEVDPNDSAQALYQKVVSKLGYIHASSLFHGLDTMKGNYAWCPPNLYDLPAFRVQHDISFGPGSTRISDLLRIKSDGSLSGKDWRFSIVTLEDMLERRLKPFISSRLFLQNRIDIALRQRHKNVLLWPPFRKGDRDQRFTEGLLAVMLGAERDEYLEESTIWVRYIACVSISGSASGVGKSRRVFFTMQVNIVDSLDPRLGVELVEDVGQELKALHWPYMSEDTLAIV